MSKIDEGGPAYPQTMQTMPNGDYIWPEQGMTLRDYFAGQALQCIIMEYCKPMANGACIGTDHFMINVPIHAYRLADAMLKARSQ